LNFNKTTLISLFLPAVIFFIISPAHSAAFDVKGLENGVRPGDVTLVTVRSSSELDWVTGRLEGKKLYFKKEGPFIFTTLIAFPMDKKRGEYKLYLRASGKEAELAKTVMLNVMKRDYRLERLKLPKNMVEPGEKQLERIRRENRALFSVKRYISKKRYWEGDFIRPVKGKIAGNFGVRRILNGVSKSPHSGNDVRAPAGSKIKSPNDGRVIYVDNMYYGGKTIVIDHGHGLSTLYMHLSKIFVNHGQEIKKGQIIGLVGSTGRSTGPHLHWGAYLYGEKVDPASLLGLSVDEVITAEFPVPGKRERLSHEQLGGN